MRENKNIQNLNASEMEDCNFKNYFSHYLEYKIMGKNLCTQNVCVCGTTYSIQYAVISRYNNMLLHNCSPSLKQIVCELGLL